MSDLTVRQRRILNILHPTAWRAAPDIAKQAGEGLQATATILISLERRGLVRRRMVGRLLQWSRDLAPPARLAGILSPGHPDGPPGGGP